MERRSVKYDMDRFGPSRARRRYLRDARRFGLACRNSIVLATSAAGGDDLTDLRDSAAIGVPTWGRLAARAALNAQAVRESGRCRIERPTEFACLGECRSVITRDWMPGQPLPKCHVCGGATNHT